MNNTDEQLINRTRVGDKEAFGELVRRYQNRLYSALVYMTNCHEEAEDIAQDTFIKAYRKIHTFHGKSAFYTWLYRIATNCVISRGRRHRPQISDLDLGIIAEQMPSGEDPGSSAQRRESMSYLRRAVADLDEHHRTVIVLRDLEGFDGPTTADMLGIPVATVRTRLHRARRQLRRRLQGMAV